jgi:hypothetical protein
VKNLVLFTGVNEVTINKAQGLMKDWMNKDNGKLLQLQLIGLNAITLHRRRSTIIINIRRI